MNGIYLLDYTIETADALVFFLDVFLFCTRDHDFDLKDCSNNFSVGEFRLV